MVGAGSMKGMVGIGKDGMEEGEIGTITQL